MTTASDTRCAESAEIAVYALRALPERAMQATEAHLAVCPECRRELARVRRVVELLPFWPTDISRPSSSLWERLEQRIAGEGRSQPVYSEVSQWPEPEWEDVAPGISCKLLASDAATSRVTMLVRLAAGAHYPSHSHAGLEELHLLDGELWIEDRKLYPGDYNRSEPGTGDLLVWSETGCTCVLITSARDLLR